MPMVAAGCGGGAPPPPRAVERSAGSSGGSAPAPGRVRAPAKRGVIRWTRLSHLAGRGARAGHDAAEWEPAFEGGPARDAELSQPYIALQGASGAIFVADKDAHAVRRIDPDGTIHTHVGTNERGDGPDTATPPRQVALGHPNGLFLIGDGSLLVLDLDNAKVRRVSADGARAETVFRVAGGLGKGRGLWATPDGDRVWVSGGTRLVLWERGKAARTLAEGFTSLGNLLGDGEGGLWVADRGGDKVEHVDASGRVTPVAGSGTAGPAREGWVPATRAPMDGPRSMVVLPGDTLLIAEHEGRRIWELRDGLARVRLDLARPQTWPAEREGPDLGVIRGMTLAPDGSLLLADDDAGYVHRLEWTREP